ncbi:hypothetical protein PR202_ga15892 [Eleusine coracana subsp. coracana]|uniref:Uncharacterized protein n=1 Tax=Eleusine coracana subsp. coracana TaxID=191504 RepID=A0AAV5CL91_ELECO|nr:hypothetical protein PR202_ga15892 [Eleusine coracana subsp. coracana]
MHWVRQVIGMLKSKIPLFAPHTHSHGLAPPHLESSAPPLGLSVASMAAEGEKASIPAPSSPPPPLVQLPSYPEVTNPFLPICSLPPVSSRRDFLWSFAARGARSPSQGILGLFRR